MSYTRDLIYFNILNLNKRIYTKDSITNLSDIQDLASKGALYGQLGYGNNTIIDMINVSHVFTNLKITKYEIIGTLEILDTVNGNLLKQLIDSMVFRPRSIGTVDNNNIVDAELITFDAVPLEDDRWLSITMSLLREKKLNRIFGE